MYFGNSAFWRTRLSKTARGWRAYLFLSLVSGALFLPGIFSLPLIGSTEGGCALIARQAALNDSYLQLSLQNSPLSPRPQGCHWLQALTLRLIGHADSVWPYRIPSFLAILGSACLIFLTGRTLFTPERGLLASLLFLLAPASALAAQTALTAALCTFFLTLNATALAYVYRHNSRRPSDLAAGYVLLFWLSAGAGILTCGLMGVLPALGILLALRLKDGSFGWLRGACPFWGVLCGIIPALPWLYAVTRAFPSLFLQDDFIMGARLLLGGDYPLLQLPGGNPSALLLLLWPAIFFLLQALHLLWRKRTRPGLFCLGWLLPILLTGLALPYSAPLLLLPALPGLCLLCAEFILSPERMPSNSLLRGLVWTACLLGALLPLLATCLLTAGLDSLRALPPAGSILPVLALMLVVATLWYVYCGARLRVCLVCLCFTLLTAPVLTVGVLPALRPHWLPLQVADTHTRLPAQHAAGEPSNSGERSSARTRLICLGLPFPEIVFYAGADTILFDDVLAAANHLLTNPGDSLAVHEKFNAGLRQALQDRRLTAELTSSISGFSATGNGVETAYFYQKVVPLPDPGAPTENIGYPDNWQEEQPAEVGYPRDSYWRSRR